MKTRLFTLLLCLCVMLTLIPVAHAEDAAVDLTAETDYSGVGYDSFQFLKDGNLKTFHRSAGDAIITLTAPQGIGSLYILFDVEYGPYTITDNATGNSVTAGQLGFLPH